MRINKYLAQVTFLSRRKADSAIEAGRVTVNNLQPLAGQDIKPSDSVLLDGKPVTSLLATTTIMLNKPVGYVVSRDGQGSRTIYELLPPEYQKLQPVGRLDKNSSGLLLLTNDGNLAQELTHPSRQKIKVYQAVLDKPLEPHHQKLITNQGVQLEDGPSKLQLTRQQDDTTWQITMHEGRNRQIRRTFAALGYTVTALHRTQFGNYQLEQLASKQIINLA